jgi:tetratricopeptide (TPR) repeat protein
MSLQISYPEPQLPIESSLLSAKFDEDQQLLQGQGNPSDYTAARQAYLQYLKFKELEDWQGAAESLKRLIQFLPTPTAYCLLGIAFYKLGELQKSVNILEKTIRLYPGFSNAHLYLGLVYIMFNKPNKALRRLWEVIRLDGNQAEIYFYLGYVHSQLNHPQLAIEAYQKAIQLEKDFSIAYLYLAKLYSDLARSSNAERIDLFNKAIEVYKILIDADPTNSAAYNYLGAIYSKLGDYERALEAYKKAVENDPNNAGAFNNLGVVFQESGRLEDAERAFQKALELDPVNTISLENLRKVKEAQLQQRLFDSGLLRQMRPPITDLTPYQHRTPIEVQGRPLSETILEERR